jgi:hypothetical protein
MICEEESRISRGCGRDFIQKHKKKKIPFLRDKECFITMKRKAACDVFLKRGVPIV